MCSPLKWGAFGEPGVGIGVEKTIGGADWGVEVISEREKEKSEANSEGDRKKTMMAHTKGFAHSTITAQSFIQVQSRMYRSPEHVFIRMVRGGVDAARVIAEYHGVVISVHGRQQKEVEGVHTCKATCYLSWRGNRTAQGFALYIHQATMTWTLVSRRFKTTMEKIKKTYRRRKQNWNEITIKCHSPWNPTAY
jgi:hypothetical protein